jgi:hypothetical protein
VASSFGKALEAPAVMGRGVHLIVGAALHASMTLALEKPSFKVGSTAGIVAAADSGSWG